MSDRLRSFPKNPLIVFLIFIYITNINSGCSRKLVAINPDGTEKWKYDTELECLNVVSPTIADDGTVYFVMGRSNSNTRIYALSPDGKEEWNLEVKGQVEHGPAIDCQGTLYIGTGEDHSVTGGLSKEIKTGDSSDDFGILHAIDSKGREKWRFKTDAMVSSSPAIDAAGMIYFSTGNLIVDEYSEDKGMLYALDPDGSQKWSLKLPNLHRSSPVIGSDKTIYIVTQKGIVYKLGAASK